MQGQQKPRWTLMTSERMELNCCFFQIKEEKLLIRGVKLPNSQRVSCEAQGIRKIKWNKKACNTRLDGIFEDRYKECFQNQPIYGWVMGTCSTQHQEARRLSLSRIIDMSNLRHSSRRALLSIILKIYR